MPYTNLPKKKWKKMENCVSSVKEKYDDSDKKVNPYAVCYTSLNKGNPYNVPIEIKKKK